MSNATLPREVVAEDRRLDQTQNKAAEALMKLRWRWTLNESNSERVSFREYARQVGKSDMVIRRDANGYALMKSANASVRTPGEARERAAMGAETQAATEAVADARGLTFQSARQMRPTEVRRVREIARQRAEDRGTSVEEEAPRVAETIARREKAQEDDRRQRAKAGDLRLVEMEQYLDRAKRPLLDALKLAREIEWSDEHGRLLEQTIANIRALLNLVDLAIVGEVEVDWDLALSKIAEG